MKLKYDPADNQAFWEQLYKIPGYPSNEEMPIRTMLFEPCALFRLPEVLGQVGAHVGEPVLVVMDPTRMQRGGADLKALILETLVQAGWQPQSLILTPDPTGQVHTDIPHIEAVKARLQAGMAVLSVGSGVVTDIAKHACYLFEQETDSKPPFVVFQTANSVSAYTSNMAPTFIDGVKRTLPSRYPDALICDLETLRDAPYEMTVAGVGDLLAAFVSFPDWRLAYLLGMDPGYNELPQTLMGPIDEIFMDEAEGICTGALPSVAALAKMIALGGLAMSLAHATTPMSGYEHVMSHVLDLINEQAQRPLAQHGTQVALASVIATQLYRRFLNEFEPAEVDLQRCYPTADRMHGEVVQAFNRVDPSGKAGEECWSDYKQKLAAWQNHRLEFEWVLKNWPSVREELRGTTRPPETLIEILRAIRSPLTFKDLTPPFDEAQVKFAYTNASLMRKRLTLGDLFIYLNWDREQLWKQVWGQSQELVKG